MREQTPREINRCDTTELAGHHDLITMRIGADDAREQTLIHRANTIVEQSRKSKDFIAFILVSPSKRKVAGDNRNTSSFASSQISHEVNELTGHLIRAWTTG